MFGIDRMKAIIDDSSKTKVSIFDEIIKQRAEFRGGLVQQDDLTLIEITMIWFFLLYNPYYLYSLVILNHRPF